MDIFNNSAWSYRFYVFTHDSVLFLHAFLSFLEAKARNRRGDRVCFGCIEESASQRRCLELFKRITSRLPHLFVYRCYQRSEKTKRRRIKSLWEGIGGSSGFSCFLLQEML